MGRKSSSSVSKSSSKAVASDWYIKQFEEYVDASDGQIGPEGIEKLCNALKLDPSDVLVLVLAWLLGASQMGYFSREEWLSGQDSLSSATSSETLVEQLQAIYAATRRSMDRLRELHKFTHKFCREERKKNIDVETAAAMLGMLHDKQFPEHIRELCDFLKGHDTAKKRGVSLDEWSMVLNFLVEIKPDCSNYQDDGAWPLLLDDYVEWLREKQEK